jgi:AcrR family transcriptional regulator
MILEKARTIFNEKGLDLTLDVLAREMGLTKGRITNHFSTKESLFQAIMVSYEWQLAEYVKYFNWPSRPLNFEQLGLYISGIMDVQYENRCGIAYITLIGEEKDEMAASVQVNYKRNLHSIRQRTEAMVAAGLLVPGILHKRNFQVFSFMIVNLLTTWVISAQQYDRDISYASIKPVYLEGVMQCYFPYLAAEGEKQYEKLNFSKLARNG